MSHVLKGRGRQQSIFRLLEEYRVATTFHIADHAYGGNRDLTRKHLRRLKADGRIADLPHPTIHRGPLVWTRSDITTTHSQKIMHQLAAVDLYVQAVPEIGKLGGRILVEQAWTDDTIPDQTVILRDRMIAVEHHLSGPFKHLPDYRRLVEERAHRACHWYREGMRPMLVIVCAPAHYERTFAAVKRAKISDMPIKVTRPEHAVSVIKELAKM